MVRTQISFTAEMHRRLKQRAARENISLAELVRRSMEDVLEHDPLPSREELLRRALNFKTFKGGPRDLAVNHDKYYVKSIIERKCR